MRRRAVMTSLISVDDGGGENWHDAGGSVRVSGGGGVYFFLPSEPKRDFRSPFSAEAAPPDEAGSVWARAPGVDPPLSGVTAALMRDTQACISSWQQQQQQQLTVSVSTSTVRGSAYVSMKNSMIITDFTDLPKCTCTMYNRNSCLNMYVHVHDCTHVSIQKCSPKQ